jgi:serine O-acetyltransferase
MDLDHKDKNLSLLETNDFINKIWINIKNQSLEIVSKEKILYRYYNYYVLSHNSYFDALINLISKKVSCEFIGKNDWEEIFKFNNYHNKNIMIENLFYKSCKDLEAVKEKDPAFTSYVNVFLNFKGWISIQIQRFSNYLYINNKKEFALILQSRCSELFGVDIHPNVKIGYGFMIDHATGVVIGETSIIGDNTIIYHNVTLGGTGKDTTDRHPKIGSNVIIGCGSIILGNINIGSGTKIGSGSIILESIEPNSVVVGYKSKIINK